MRTHPPSLRGAAKPRRSNLVFKLISSPIICAFLLSDISYANTGTLSLQIWGSPKLDEARELMIARRDDRAGTIEECAKRHPYAISEDDAMAGARRSKAVKMFKGHPITGVEVKIIRIKTSGGAKIHAKVTLQTGRTVDYRITSSGDFYDDMYKCFLLDSWRYRLSPRQKTKEMPEEYFYAIADNAKVLTELLDHPRLWKYLLEIDQVPMVWKNAICAGSKSAAGLPQPRRVDCGEQAAVHAVTKLA